MKQAKILNISQGYSSKRMLIATTLFLSMLLFIFLVRSPSPFGITLTEDTTNTIQTIGVQTVQYQDGYSYKRNFIGQVEAQQTSQLGFEVAGRLKTIIFDEGDSVKTGDILAILDTARLDARINEAEANLGKANADAKFANNTYNRIRVARRAKAVSAQEKDDADENKDITAAAVKVAEAQLQSIKVDLEKSKLIAPFDGTVIRRMADQGDVVNIAQSVLQVQQNSNYNIRIGVSHVMAKNLTVLDEKNIKLNGESYKAVISAILPVRSKARTIDVILKLKQSDGSVRPGDMVRLPLNHKVSTPGFWVPLTALKEGHRGLWSLYLVDQNQKPLIAERRAIQVHYTNSEQAFVSGAVEDGDTIIILGAAKLVPGQQVRVLENNDDA